MIDQIAQRMVFNRLRRNVEKTLNELEVLNKSEEFGNIYLLIGIKTNYKKRGRKRKWILILT